MPVFEYDVKWPDKNCDVQRQVTFDANDLIEIHSENDNQIENNVSVMYEDIQNNPSNEQITMEMETLLSGDTVLYYFGIDSGLVGNLLTETTENSKQHGKGTKGGNNSRKSSGDNPNGDSSGESFNINSHQQEVQLQRESDASSRISETESITQCSTFSYSAPLLKGDESPDSMNTNSNHDVSSLHDQLFNNDDILCDEKIITNAVNAYEKIKNIVSSWESSTHNMMNQVEFVDAETKNNSDIDKNLDENLLMFYFAGVTPQTCPEAGGSNNNHQQNAQNQTNNTGTENNGVDNENRGEDEEIPPSNGNGNGNGNGGGDDEKKHTDNNDKEEETKENDEDEDDENNEEEQNVWNPNCNAERFTPRNSLPTIIENCDNCELLKMNNAQIVKAKDEYIKQLQNEIKQLKAENEQLKSVQHQNCNILNKGKCKKKKKKKKKKKAKGGNTCITTISKKQIVEQDVCSPYSAPFDFPSELLELISKSISDNIKNIKEYMQKYLLVCEQNSMVLCNNGNNVVIDFRFHNKQNSKTLFVVSDKIYDEIEGYQWKMRNKLYCVADISEEFKMSSDISKIKPTDAEVLHIGENFIEIQKMLHNQGHRNRIIIGEKKHHVKWQNIPIYAKSSTLKLTIEEFVIKLKTFAENEKDIANLVPIISFIDNGWLIEYIWVVDIGYGTIGISLSVKKNNLFVHGIHLSINDNHILLVNLFPGQFVFNSMALLTCKFSNLVIGEEIKINRLSQQNKQLQIKLNKAQKTIEKLNSSLSQIKQEIENGDIDKLFKSLLLKRNKEQNNHNQQPDYSIVDRQIL